MRSLTPLALAVLVALPTGARAQDEPEAPQQQAPGEEQAVPTIRSGLVLSGHGQIVHGVAFSPDGKLLASAAEDGAILWDLATGKQIRKLDPGEENRSGAFSVAFAPDGKTLAVGGWFGDVYLYDTAGKLKGKLDEPSLAVICLAYSPDGSTIAASNDQAEVMLFDTKESKLLGTIKAAKGSIKQFTFSADGKTLVAMTGEELSTWDVKGRKLLKSLPLEGTGIEWAYTAVACSPKAPVVVATGGKLLSQKTVAYDLKTLRPQGALETTQFDPSIRSLAFSPDGKALATAGGGTIDSSPVILWDVSTGRKIVQLAGQKESLEKVAFSADGRRVAAVGADRTVGVWTVKAGGTRGSSQPKAKAKSKGRAKSKKAVD